MFNPLLETVAAHAAAAPEKAAVIASGRAVSYGELWRSTAAACALLVRLGVRPGDRVILSASASSPSFVYGYLGTHLAGGIAVPVDPQTPESRLAYIARRVEPRAIFVAGRAGEPSVPARAIEELERSDSNPQGELLFPDLD